MPDFDSATLPTIAAVVGVCDEHELIARCISHLESQDVSAIVVVDNGSVDGTREILRGFEADGRITLIETRGDPREDHDYFARGIRLAKQRFKPDWILVQDADEFWVHRSGALRRGLVDVAVPCLSVQRFNACLCEALMRFPIDLTIEPDALDLFMEPCLLSRERMDEDKNLRWIAAQPVDKIIAQASALVGVSAGGHAAVGSDGHSLPPPDVARLPDRPPPLSRPAAFRAEGAER